MLAPAFAALACLAGCTQLSPRNGLETVTIKGHVFHLELAANDESRTEGLMRRTEIAEDGGMLFVFPEAAYRSFWMGYCVIDIDILFLDAHGRITAVHRMVTEAPRRADEAEPAYRQRLASYDANFPAQFAIELRAGWLDRLELRVGDKIDLDLDRLKKQTR